MIDSTRPGVLHADSLVDALQDRGFSLEPHGAHVVARRDTTVVVLPAPGRSVPETFARRLEHVLRPLLGAGWFDPSAATVASVRPEPGDVLVLDAVVDQCARSGDWCSFLPSELSVMGTGSTREEALRDLKEAAAIWLGLVPERIALMTPDVV
jgi:predicted RNase H-like HicB family nuclease